MNHNSHAHQVSALVKQHRPDFNPLLGIVLGSGLGDFAGMLEDTLILPYDLLPGFPELTIQGHTGNMILGRMNGMDIICLQGRAHSYEGIDHDVVKTYVRSLKLAGCQYFLATNASGSLRAETGPGELMLITDHINMQPCNPLTGPNDDEFGPRFYPLDNAYDKTLRDAFLKVAEEENIPLHQGVYISVLGPNYETAAEIKAFQILGADAVGMSTVPEVLVANHCGMKVAVIATITNYATGLATSSHSHEAVVATAQRASERLNRLVRAFIGELNASVRG